MFGLKKVFGRVCFILIFKFYVDREDDIDENVGLFFLYIKVFKDLGVEIVEDIGVSLGEEIVVSIEGNVKRNEYESDVEVEIV